MDIFSDKKIPVFSLDIETTTLDPFKSKTWSMGVAQRGGKGKEYFNSDVISASSANAVEDLFQAHKEAGAEFFGQTQRDAGSFDGFAKAHSSGALTSIDNTMKDITSDLRKSAGVLLVQNTNFESNTLGWAKHKSGGQNMSEDVRSSFVKDLFGDSPEKMREAQLLPVESEILDARAKFTEASSKLKRSSEFSQDVTRGFGEDLKLATKDLENTITKVVKQNAAAGNMTVIDLMDISRIYTSKLYEGGGIKQPFVGSGLSVSFLSLELLKEAEAHTALSDADQQLRVFDKLTERISNFNKTGVLTQDDLDYGKALTNSDTHDRSFLSALSSRLTEAQDKGKDLSDESLVRKELRAPLKQYSPIPEKSFNREAYVKDIAKKFITSPEDTLRDLHEHSNSKSLTNYKNMSKEISDLAPTSEDLDFKPKKLSNSSKILLGLSAVGVVSALTASNRPKDEPLTSYNDLYENVYLGQSYADWKERNNSHKMIY